MRAMVFEGVGRPLRPVEMETPRRGDDEVLVEIGACAICRTDLHIVDGDLTGGMLPVIPGHEIVGRVKEVGASVERLEVGQRVGIPWLGGTCGRCRYCRDGMENLCDDPEFTGYTRNGGFAGACVARADYVFPLPDSGTDAELAPLMCAGLIGHRSLRMAGDARRVGLYGFGAAAHIVTQVAVWRGQEIYAFTRPGDTAAQALATMLGARWAGGSDDAAPVELDAAILFAPMGALVPVALRAVRKGGTVVCGGIHMSDIPGFPYADLWGERVVRSVANLTRADAEDFLSIVGPAGVRTEITEFPLEEANAALDGLRAGAITGAAVLVP